MDGGGTGDSPAPGTGRERRRGQFASTLQRRPRMKQGNQRRTCSTYIVCHWVIHTKLASRERSANSRGLSLRMRRALRPFSQDGRWTEDTRLPRRQENRIDFYFSQIPLW